MWKIDILFLYSKNIFYFLFSFPKYSEKKKESIKLHVSGSSKKIYAEKLHFSELQKYAKCYFFRLEKTVFLCLDMVLP